MPEDINPVRIPSDLSTLSVDDLAQLETAARAEFAALDGAEAPSNADLDRMEELASGVEALRTERTNRAAAVEAAATRRESLRGRVATPEGGDDDGTAGEPAPTPAPTPDPTPAVTAAARPTTDVRDVIKAPNANLNARLSDARGHQPPSAQPRIDDEFAASVLVASADIPGYTTGGRIPDMAALVQAFRARSRALPVTKMGMQAPRYPIAQLQRNFRHTLDPNATPEQIREIIESAADPDALVAAGGWCSPSEIRYDFYNIVAMDGMLDLPTVGVNRGGIRWPVSPSIADLAGAGCLWHWTETQDIAAATGTSQSGTKTCCRVPCAEMHEARLECDGLCVTAGNLTEDAWPELVANYLNLVNAAHAHRMNAWAILSLVAGSIAVSPCATGMGLTIPLLDAIELQAVDYRTRYRMQSWEVLEVVLPEWILGGVRSDLSKRVFGSPDFAFSITNAQIGQWFTDRYVRVQFVQDWQTGQAGFPGQTVGNELTTWPTTVQFLLYAAGTWLRGNGMSLDLGVVRDSTLNATNDHTAAWSEECMLIAEIGHESRICTVPICPDGAVGAAHTFACPSC